MMSTTLIDEFKTRSVEHLQENLPRLATCLAELTEAEVWQRPNPASNSIGNLLLHLCGNVNQYILASLVGEPDTRQRDEEFVAKGGLTKAELMQRVQDTVDRACAVIMIQDEASLLRERSVQAFRKSGLGIITHVVEHFSYHVGQVAFWTKALKNEDLGFYAHLDLDTPPQ